MKLARAKREQLVGTLRRARSDGTFNAALVADIAAAAGVSERYVYSLARDGMPAVTRVPWRLTDRSIELYYEKRARIPAVHSALVAAGEEVPALRQLQRAFATQLGVYGEFVRKTGLGRDRRRRVELAVGAAVA